MGQLLESSKTFQKLITTKTFNVGRQGPIEKWNDERIVTQQAIP